MLQLAQVAEKEVKREILSMPVLSYSQAVVLTQFDKGELIPMKVKIFSVLSVFVLVLSLFLPVSSITLADKGVTSGFEDGTIARPEPMVSTADPAIYIIKLEGDSLSSYQGGVPGLAATNPEALGESKLDAKAPPASPTSTTWLGSRLGS